MVSSRCGEKQVIADLCFLIAEGKIAHALVELENRSRQRTLKGAPMPEKITHETLANQTGLTRSTVTTILNDFENMNVLRKRRGSTFSSKIYLHSA
jgi:CRP-like cAMP-binding protein